MERVLAEKKARFIFYPCIICFLFQYSAKSDLTHILQKQQKLKLIKDNLRVPANIIISHKKMSVKSNINAILDRR